MEQYILKSALVAEIEKLENVLSDPLMKINGEDYINGGKKIIKEMKSFLNTLEVKEVDLEKNLTWEDIGTIDQLLWELSIEWSGKEDNEGYFKEVLKRFKAQKA